MSIEQLFHIPGTIPLGTEGTRVNRQVGSLALKEPLFPWSNKYGNRKISNNDEYYAKNKVGKCDGE